MHMLTCMAMRLSASEPYCLLQATNFAAWEPRKRGNQLRQVSQDDTCLTSCRQLCQFDLAAGLPPGQELA